MSNSNALSIEDEIKESIGKYFAESPYAIKQAEKIYGDDYMKYMVDHIISQFGLDTFVKLFASPNKNYFLRALFYYFTDQKEVFYTFMHFCSEKSTYFRCCKKYSEETIYPCLDFFDYWHIITTLMNSDEYSTAMVLLKEVIRRGYYVVNYEHIEYFPHCPSNHTRKITLLREAVYCADLVEELIKNGADVNKDLCSGTNADPTLMGLVLRFQESNKPEFIDAPRTIELLLNAGAKLPDNLEEYDISMLPENIRERLITEHKKSSQ